MSEMWKCQECGYVHVGEEPDDCWKCGEESSIEKLSQEKAEKIMMAWRSNDLHMQLNSLLEEMQDIAGEGIEENLDPGCHEIFSRAKGCSEKLQQAIKAEIATHVDKGKWG